MDNLDKILSEIKLSQKDFELIKPVFKEVPPYKQGQYIKEGVRSWAFMAINAIASRISMLDIEAFQVKADKSEIPISHPIEKLLEKPNPLQTKNQFIWQLFVYYLAAGEVPIILDRPTNPTELIILNPEKLKVNYDKKFGIGSYQYRRSDGVDIPIKENELILFNQPSLTTPLRGEGIMKYVADTLDIDMYFERYLKKFFWNDATPGFMLSTEKEVSKEWVERLMAKLEKRNRSWKNAFKALILTGGLKPNKVGTNLSELQIKEINEFTMNKVLAAFQVPKAVLGIGDDVRANNDVADRTFSRYAVLPRMKMLEQEFNQFLLPKFTRNENVVVRFENPVKEDQKLNAEIHQIYVNSGVLTANEVREELGYKPIEEEPIQIEEPKEEQEEDQVEEIEEVEEKTNNKKSKGFEQAFEDMLRGNRPKKTQWTEKEVEEYHEKKIGITELQEQKLKEGLNKYFDELINKIVRETKEQKAVIEEGEAELNFNQDIEEKKLVKLIIPFYEDVIVQQSGITYALLGLSDAIPSTSKITKEFLDEYSIKFAYEVTNTSKKKIEKIFKNWAKKDEPISELRKKLKNKMSDLSRERIEDIARTEVQRAAGYASREVYQRTGAVGYKWFTAEDERVCQFCRPMNGKTIKSNQTFWPKKSSMIGESLGKLDFDYDSVRHPPLHVRCRCTILGIYDEAEIPNNPLRFREDSQQRETLREEQLAEKEKQIRIVEKLQKAKDKIKERKTELDKREKKIKEVENLL